MPKKIVLKTKETKRSPAAFLNTVTDKEQRTDAKKLLALFRKVTGKQPKMWGPSIIGFGSYTYTRSNGDVGEFLATGFSPRKGNLTLYIMPGYQNYDDMLKKLGPHKLGKSCLDIKELEDIDTQVLEKLIKRGLVDLKKTHLVK
ncbi:MAG: DUF1801 domain-containing protein [Candidatus Paceibacterota bacterium]